MVTCYVCDKPINLRDVWDHRAIGTPRGPRHTRCNMRKSFNSESPASIAAERAARERNAQILSFPPRRGK